MVHPSHGLGWWANARTRRRVTLLEAIMRGLKRGKEAEFKLAAQLLDVVVLTMGTDSEQIYPEIRPSLSVLIMDNTVSPDVRSVVGVLMLLSALCSLLSALCSLLSALCSLLSALSSLLSYLSI